MLAFSFCSFGRVPANQASKPSSPGAWCKKRIKSCGSTYQACQNSLIISICHSFATLALVSHVVSSAHCTCPSCVGGSIHSSCGDSPGCATSLRPDCVLQPCLPTAKSVLPVSLKPLTAHPRAPQQPISEVSGVSYWIVWHLLLQHREDFADLTQWREPTVLHRASAWAWMDPIRLRMTYYLQRMKSTKTEGTFQTLSTALIYCTYQSTYFYRPVYLPTYPPTKPAYLPSYTH